MKKYLIDESIIVYLNRKDYDYHSQLVAFLENGRITKSNKNKKHEFFMPYHSRIRLGIFKLYSIHVLIKRWLKKSALVIDPLEKVKFRASIAKLYINKYLKLPFITRIKNIFFSPSRLIDLFVFSNTEKSKELQVKKRGKIKPDQLISLTSCEIAMIANKYDMDLISFNKDFNYLTNLPGERKVYFKYIHPDDILKNYHISGPDNR